MLYLYCIEQIDLFFKLFQHVKQIIEVAAQREASGELIDRHVGICGTGRRMEQDMESPTTLGRSSQVHTAACL
jgi:hypothetical protein